MLEVFGVNEGVPSANTFVVNNNITTEMKNEYFFTVFINLIFNSRLSLGSMPQYYFDTLDKSKRKDFDSIIFSTKAYLNSIKCNFFDFLYSKMSQKFNFCRTLSTINC